MAQMPANIRISAQFPFPATVQGAAPIVITKLNGIWTVSLNVANLAQQVPPPANYATDFLVVFDAVANSFFKVPLSGAGSIIGRVRLQRSVVATPIIVASNDEILNCNINVAAACALPASATRSGLPLTFKDVGPQFGANHLTLTPNGAETIDGKPNLVLNTDRQAVTLVPLNDGTNSGWAIE